MDFSKYLSLLFLLLCSFNLQTIYSQCPKILDCGNLGSLEFPFTNVMKPECGPFELVCGPPSPPTIQFRPDFNWFEVLEKPSRNELRILDPSLRNQLDNRSCLSFRNLSLPFNSPILPLSLISPSLTLFSCPNTSSKNESRTNFEPFQVYRGCARFTVYYRYPQPDQVSQQPTIRDRDRDRLVPMGCSLYKMPIGSDPNSTALFDLLTAEFVVKWDFSDDCLSCHHRGGQCSFNNNEFHCEIAGKSKIRKILITGGSSVVGLATIILIICSIMKRNDMAFRFLQKKTKNQKDFEIFLKNNQNIALRRYKYFDLKKMTKSFAENLGKGGYGGVYKGQLPDKSLVAVKILNLPKENGQDFMNEVASISRTSHINIVSLVGFCFEGSKRALVYEFMPNGSLEKFAQNAASSSEVGLRWEKLYDIALGVARGLEYLHRGCNTRIIHFDIKPHNILLDKDLNPKISDFGLAKLCPNRSSIVKMSEARGTIGYIAPEIFCRNFGEVSYKSDVYSYGMMVLDIVGMKKKNNLEIDLTSETYFPQYIYKQLEIEDQESGVEGVEVDPDESHLIKRKLIIVGLWCIQTDPRDRPSISRVIEMLEGDLELLQIPPKPYLSSPQRSPPMLSTSESISLLL